MVVEIHTVAGSSLSIHVPASNEREGLIPVRSGGLGDGTLRGEAAVPHGFQESTW